MLELLLKLGFGPQAAPAAGDRGASGDRNVSGDPGLSAKLTAPDFLAAVVFRVCISPSSSAETLAAASAAASAIWDASPSAAHSTMCRSAQASTCPTSLRSVGMGGLRRSATSCFTCLRIWFSSARNAPALRRTMLPAMLTDNRLASVAARAAAGASSSARGVATAAARLWMS
eukprot:scaffold40308_cov60-Phaeocystis_antarctica.AAC.3